LGTPKYLVFHYSRTKKQQPQNSTFQNQLAVSILPGRQHSPALIDEWSEPHELKNRTPYDSLQPFDVEDVNRQF
jgi:hypothetical protein